MPKQRNRMGQGSAPDSQRTPFNALLIGTLSAGVAGININPSNANLSPTRLVSEADAWAFWKLESFRFRLHPPDTAPSSAQAAGFVGAIQDTSPGTVAQVGELLPSAYLSVRQLTPTKWVTPSPSEMKGLLPWYRTVTGSEQTTESSVGQIIVVGNTTNSFVLEVAGVIVFKTAVATGNTPAAARLLREARMARQAQFKRMEQERLLAILGGGTPTFSPPTQ